jgi:DNA-binding transcriptional ArsR family regulator
MEKYNLDIDFLKLLADSNRMTIIYFLQNGEKSFKQIMNCINKSQSIVSSNLKLLIQETLVESRTEHGNKYFRIKNPKIFTLLQQITTFVVEKEQDKLLNRSLKDAQDIF